MAMKYLVVIVVIAVVLWLMLGRRGRGRAAPPKAKPRPELEGMIRCAHCGVHLPRSEALTAGGHSYCSAAHRDAGPRADA